MKDKIINFLKNKSFWRSVLECLCIIFIIIVSYFIGFSNGLLIDNDIRQDFINENLKTDKKQVNNFNKKTAINVNDVPTFDGEIVITQRGSFNIGVIKSTSSTRFVMLDYTISIGQPDGSTSKVYYTIDVDVDLSDTFNNSSYTDLNVVRNSYTSIFFSSFYGTHDISLEYLKHFQCNFIPSVFKNTDANGNEKLFFHLDLQLDFTAVNNTKTYEDIRSDDYVVSGFNTLNLAFITTNDYYVIFNDVNSQLVFYYNGYIDGYDNGEKIGFDNGKIQGYEDRKNSVDDQEQVTNNIWNILEKGIETTLNVLSMEILPGIPLFVCIAIPILIGILVWVIKMGAQ